MPEPFEALYRLFNRPEWIGDDPVQWPRRVPAGPDRELAGLVAAALAFGQVRQIHRSVAAVMDPLGPTPSLALSAMSARETDRLYKEFRHRWIGPEDLIAFLGAIRWAFREHGSLGDHLASCLKDAQGDVRRGLAGWVRALKDRMDGRGGYLLPDPAGGGAAKRLHLFLRWMVRQDAVDPGGWTMLTPAQLLPPLDTHLHRLALRLGFTTRRQATARAVDDVASAFRILCPKDPVRYDFALTRVGIGGESARNAVARIPRMADWFGD